MKRIILAEYSETKHNPLSFNQSNLDSGTHESMLKISENDMYNPGFIKNIFIFRF